MQEREIYLFGPLCLSIEVECFNTLSFAHEVTEGSAIELTLGGPLLKIARNLKAAGYRFNLFTYIGSDTISEQILIQTKMEFPDANIQKIANSLTPIFFKLTASDNKNNFSMLKTMEKNLYLWLLRFKNLKKNSIVFFDAAIPQEIQAKFINTIRNATIILTAPIKEKLNIIENNLTVYYALNEWQALQFFAKHYSGLFDLQKIFNSNEFEHTFLTVQIKNFLFTLDETKANLLSLELYSLSQANKTSQQNGINEGFFAGMISAISSKQNYYNVFNWGHYFAKIANKNKPFDKMMLMEHMEKNRWQIEENF